MNPYKNLADGFLIYNACYPIRYNKNSNRVTCSKKSMGINIRIYKLTIGEYEIFKIRDNKYVEFDVCSKSSLRRSYLSLSCPPMLNTLRPAHGSTQKRKRIARG